MPNPFEGRSVQFAREIGDPLDEFSERLRLLGASPDEVAGVVEHWNDFDDEWTEEVRDQLRIAPDVVLMRLLASGREEYFEHTHDEDEQAEIEAAERHAELLVDVQGRIGGTVEALKAWIDEGGDDDEIWARASAVYDLEIEGQNRVTLTNWVAERWPAAFEDVDGQAAGQVTAPDEG